MDDNFFRQILTNGQLEGLISSMELLLHEAKLKQPEKDFKPQNENIRVLREFQYEYLQTIEENRILTKRNFEHMENIIRQTDILNSLKKEIENLKANITF